MSIRAKIFARIGGEIITQYTLQNVNGLTLRLLTFGARVQQVRLAANGRDPNLILGFITLQDYLQQPGAFGAMVGPTAADRNGWQNWNWRARTAEGPDFDRVTFTLALAPGADGQPGARTITVVHTLYQDNRWVTTTTIETTHAVTLAPTQPIAWQLTGDPAKTVLAERLTVAGQPQPVPTTATTVAGAVILTDAPWTLHFATTAPLVRLDPLATVAATNNFNGVLGQPHVGLICQPLLATTDLTLTPGTPCSWTNTVSLTTEQE